MVTVGSADPELSNQGDRELGRSFVYKKGVKDPNSFGISDEGTSKPSRLEDYRGSKGLAGKGYSSPNGSQKASKASMMPFEEDQKRAKTISNMQRFMTVKYPTKGR